MRLPIYRQRGTAIITALLVVLLATSIASFLLVQQSRALTRTARATERAQATLFARPMLQWARAALFEFQKNNQSVDLTQRWAQPIAAAPIEGAVASGFFRDESGRFNVNSMVNDDGKKSDADILIFKRLLENLGLNPDLAAALADWIDRDDETGFPGGAEDSAYLALPQPYRAANQRIVQIEELYSVRGFDGATVKKLKPFITALPSKTKININTAPEEVLAAVLPTLGRTAMGELLSRRIARPFTSTDGENGIQAYFKNVPTETGVSMLSVNSGYFSVALGVSTGGVVVRQSALLQSVASNTSPPKSIAWPRIIWIKDD